MVSQQLVEVIFFGAFVIAGLYFISIGLRELVVTYRILVTEPTPVTDLPTASGPVEVTGVAWIHERTLKAPLTKRSCLAYEWAIQEKRTDEEGDTEWVTVDSGRENVPFVVEDETGSVLVDPRDAEFRLEKKRTVRRGLPGLSIGPFDFSFGRARRYLETRLDPDEPVYVYGTVTPAPAESDDADRVDARIEEGQPFIVADGTESEVTLRVLGKAVVYVLGGAAFIGVAVWFRLFGGQSVTWG
jgi:hypothetical protein